MTPSLVIDTYVDLICPWCLIGKRHLSRALAEFAQGAPDTKVALRWHSVQLLPNLPPAGLDFEAFYLNRLGSAQAVQQRRAQVVEAAQQAGAEVDFTRIARMPNTLMAHQLLAFASERLSAPDLDQLLERLLAAHFSEGKNLGNVDTLLRIAADFDLPGEALRAWLQAGRGRPAAVDVPGVPFFVFNHQIALSGAQPPAQLLAAMHQALEGAALNAQAAQAAQAAQPA